MKAVFKYKFGFDTFGLSGLRLPVGCKILRVGQQEGEMCFWAEVDSDADIELRQFQMIGTGHKLPKSATYIGGVSIPPYEWHIYELA